MSIPTIEQIAEHELQRKRELTNIIAGLFMVRCCEGTDSANGYRYLFGSKVGQEVLFDSFTDHPNIRKEFRWKESQEIGYSTAAGAYQIIFKTWDGIRRRLALPDFSPGSQDRAAEQLIADRGAYDDLRFGHIQSFIDKCSVEWASLPSSKYDQPKRTIGWALDRYRSAGGVVAE